VDREQQAFSCFKPPDDVPLAMPVALPNDEEIEHSRHSNRYRANFAAIVAVTAAAMYEGLRD
jgi:hypothetical protein